MAIHALIEGDLEMNTDQVKQVIDEAFERATQKQEEMHSDMQAYIVAL
jgi:hypothetical protein